MAEDTDLAHHSCCQVNSVHYGQPAYLVARTYSITVYKCNKTHNYTCPFGEMVVRTALLRVNINCCKLVSYATPLTGTRHQVTPHSHPPTHLLHLVLGDNASLVEVGQECHNQLKTACTASLNAQDHRLQGVGTASSTEQVHTAGWKQLRTSYTSSWWKWGTSKSLKQRQAYSEGRTEEVPAVTTPTHCTDEGPPPLARTSWTSAEDRYSSRSRPICGGRHTEALTHTVGNSGTRPVPV